MKVAKIKHFIVGVLCCLMPALAHATTSPTAPAHVSPKITHQASKSYKSQSPAKTATQDNDAIIDEILAEDTNYTSQDPWYSYNHAVYKFNDGFDKYLLKPIAKGYAFILPSFVRTGITHFFNNLSEIPTIINDVLQLDIYQSLADTWRLAINTTVGVGGLFDVAQLTGLEPHDNDVGLTFAKWGWKDSSYFVIPFLGPSTIRDTIGLPINAFITVWPYVPWYVGYPAFAVDIVNLRANQLPADPLLQQLSVDPYMFLRDAYLQHRNYQINLLADTSMENNPYVHTKTTAKSNSKIPEDRISPKGPVDQALTQ